MARHKRDEAIKEDKPKLDISSMIDATFLLLIYFLVTTTILPQEKDVPMALPASQQTEEMPEIAPKLIRVEANGEIFVGEGTNTIPMDTDATSRDVPLLYSDLETYAENARSVDSDPLVQIYVDGEASQQRVIDVLNALNGVGINKVTFTDLVDP